MKPRAFRYLAFWMAAASVGMANDKWYVECKKTCKTCGDDSSCQPGVTTYTVGSTYDSKSEAQNAASQENSTNKGAQCKVKESQGTSGGGQAVETENGVTPLNYKREGILFDGVAPDYVMYETVDGVKKPLQFPTKNSTIIYSDLSDGTGYQKAQYLTSQLSAANSAGIRTIPSGVNPIAVTIYRNPDGDATTTSGRLDVIHRQKHPQTGAWVATTIRITSPQGSNSWKREWFLGDLVQNPTLTPYQSVDVSRTPHLDGTETVREITKNTTSSGSLVIGKDQTLTYGFYKYGEPVILSQTDHTGTASELTTTWTYYTDPQRQESFNKQATMRRNDGQWANYSYSGSLVTGVIQTKTVSGWLDNAAPAVGDSADENSNKVVTEVEAGNETGTFGREEKVQGVVVSKTWGERYKDNAGQVIEKSRVETGTATLLTVRTGYPTTTATPEAERGELKSVEFPDGTVELHSYQMQGTNKVETVERGAGSVDGVTSGTRTTSTTTADGTLIKEIVADIASGVEFSAREAIAFDTNGRVTRWAYDHNPDDYSETLYGCCGIDSTRTRDGIVTTYTRDALKRPLTAVSRGVTLTYTYAKKTVGGTDYPAVSQVNSAGGLTQDLGTEVSDYSGNVIQRLNPDLDGDSNEEVTSIVHDFTTRTTTTTHPDGGTEIAIGYADGQSKSISGTAVAPTALAYTPHNEQGGGLVTTTYAGNPSSSRWTKTYANLEGNTFKVTAPGDSGELAIQSQTYDNVGRLVKTANADGVTQLFAYNAEGKRYRTALDLNQNGQIDNADRVTDNLREVVTDSPVGPAIKQQSVVYDLANNPVVVSTTYQSVDGLASRTEVLGSAGASIFGVEPYTARTDSSWTATTTNPDGTKTLTTYSNWQVISSALLNTENSALKILSTGYDSLLRPTIQTDSRTGAVTTSYAASGLVASINDHGRVTTFGYDSMGRRISVTLPDSSVARTSYWPTGQEKAAWGSQTNPVVKLYSPQGELTELRTFLSSNLALAPDEATSDYDATMWAYNNRGQLTAKTYADGKGPSYSYTAAGRLHARTWARTVGGNPLVTTYGYNSAGELTLTDYSDTTPDVAIVFDKLGRQTSVSNGVATSTFTYDSATLRQTSETISYDLNQDGTPELTRVLNHSWDSLGRSTGFQLKNGSTVENEASYAYSATDGRISSISNPQSTNLSFSYSYLANSNLIESVIGPSHTVTNTWASDRDVLLSKENKAGTTTISKYEYSVNSLSQRTTVSQIGTAFAASTGWNWGYDSLGQVTSAAHATTPANHRAYQYDAIGNRKKSTDSLTLPGSDNYMSNALNQYTTINQPPSAINPSYDDDGNATAYPLPVSPTTNSTLIWDGENRLMEVQVGASGPLVRYVYDSQSRRIARTEGTAITLYVYDGWNVVAEYSPPDLQSPISHVRSYLWGTDLSDSFQGAGGVGGLLCVTGQGSSSSPFFPAYDGNGNVSEYLDGSGAIVAHFEYDPFGNTIVNTDITHQFAYCFSTRPRDVLAGLHDYGLRWYNTFTGRWVSRDYIEEEGGLNLYGFVKNDAIDRIDIFGTTESTVTGDPPTVTRGSSATMVDSSQVEGSGKTGPRIKTVTLEIISKDSKCCVRFVTVNYYIRAQVSPAFADAPKSHYTYWKKLTVPQRYGQRPLTYSGLKAHEETHVKQYESIVNDITADIKDTYSKMKCFASNAEATTEKKRVEELYKEERWHGTAKVAAKFAEKFPGRAGMNPGEYEATVAEEAIYDAIYR
ncbi:MAG: RHS repeat-associated core domain-containing protein [Luteolibacter sp.]